MTTHLDPSMLPPLPLPSGITSRYVDCSPSSLIFHILESKPANITPSTPVILLIHGFPELAFSWRHMLPQLSCEPNNFYAIALDQRGYGRTHPSKSAFPLPQSSFRPMNLIRDVLRLLSALGISRINCVVGHDFGGVTAALLALSRPDIFQSCILMSHPTKGPPNLPWNTANGSPPPSPGPDMVFALAQQSPPRKHYKWYYCTPNANEEMTYPTGEPLHSFLRGYFHLKSADWSGNSPHKLSGWTASELVQMPSYYIMNQPHTMRQDVAQEMSQPTVIKEIESQPYNRWLSDQELQVYVDEYGRNEFQGGLNWYRIQTQPEIASDTELFAGMKIRVPCMFVAGEADWGTWQEPGAVEAMEHGKSVESQCWRGKKIVPGAGHWVNQERPRECVGFIVEMVQGVKEEELSRS